MINYRKFLIVIGCFLLFSKALIAQEIKASETQVLLNISVTNMKSMPLASEKVIIVGQKTKKQIQVITDKQGKGKVLIPKGDIYDVKYKDLVEIQNYSSIDVPASPGLFAYDLILQFEPAKSIILKNVLFDTGKASLKKESYPALNDLFDVLNFKKSTVIEIAGHTDNVGNSETNLKLSQDRANSVRSYLIAKGIGAERIIAKGYGDVQPIADNSTEKGKQENRRTEVRIIKE